MTQLIGISHVVSPRLEGMGTEAFAMASWRSNSLNQ